MARALGRERHQQLLEEFSPRRASKMETAVSQSPDDGSSSGMVSMVVNRSQTTSSRDQRPLLLKLGGLQSDCAGVLGFGLILLQSRELGIGITLLTVSCVALGPHRELGLDVALGGWWISHAEPWAGWPFSAWAAGWDCCRPWVQVDYRNVVAQLAYTCPRWRAAVWRGPHSSGDTGKYPLF